MARRKNLRRSPSGPVNGLKGVMTLASTEISGQAAATQTGTFNGARVGDVVSLSPRANLTDPVGIAWCRVVSDDVIAVSFYKRRELTLHGRNDVRRGDTPQRQLDL